MEGVSATLHRTEDLLRELEGRLPEGSTDPYPAWAAASDLGVSERTIQSLVGDLIDRGVLVGSSCGAKPGFFLITNEDELFEGTQHIVSRARSSFARVNKLRAAAAREFGPHTERLFSLEEVGAT